MKVYVIEVTLWSDLYESGDSKIIRVYQNLQEASNFMHLFEMDPERISKRRENLKYRIWFDEDVLLSDEFVELCDAVDPTFKPLCMTMIECEVR